MILSTLRHHRQWVLLIALAAVVLVVTAMISLRLVERVSKGPAFQASAAFLRANPIARQQLGVVTGFGVGVAGDVTEEGGGGSAHLSFQVNGSWRDGRASITAVKRHDRWWVSAATLSVDGRQFPLPAPVVP
jgi:hypothetical protein